MSYMWNEFNIKTFPAETVVFRDGSYCADLSTLKNTDIDKNYDLPVHIIYTGEISGDNIIDINIGASNQPVFLSVDVKNNLPAKLKIFIKNAGENSELRGHVRLENSNTLEYECRAMHFVKNTGILVNSKLLAGRNSLSKMHGSAIIKPYAENAVSDIALGAMAVDETARIEFMPAQYISSVPTSADHSASLYKPAASQILYLRQAGLSGAEVDTALRDAFLNNFNLF